DLGVGPRVAGAAGASARVRHIGCARVRCTESFVEAPRYLVAPRVTLPELGSHRDVIATGVLDLLDGVRGDLAGDARPELRPSRRSEVVSEEPPVGEEVEHR